MDRGLWGPTRIKTVSDYQKENGELAHAYQELAEQNETLHVITEQSQRELDMVNKELSDLKKYMNNVLGKNDKFFRENDRLKVKNKELEGDIATLEFLKSANGVLRDRHTDLLNTNISIRDILEMKDPALLNDSLLRQEIKETSISIRDIVTRQNSEMYKSLPKKDSKQLVKDNREGKPHDGKTGAE